MRVTGFRNRIFLTTIKAGKDKGEMYLSANLRYQGKKITFAINMGKHPQLEAKLAYLQKEKLLSTATHYEKWLHNHKIWIIQEYFRLKKLVELVEGASNG